MGVKIYRHVAGNTLGSHEQFLDKMKKRGAKIVETEEGSDETIVFCPIVSRFETDIQAALSNISGKRQVILVAMHHTYDPHYTLPDRRSHDTRVKLFVDCLFFEKRGLYKCERNTKAKKKVCKQLGLPKHLGPSIGSSKNQADNAEPKKSKKKINFQNFFKKYKSKTPLKTDAQRRTEK